MNILVDVTTHFPIRSVKSNLRGSLRKSIIFCTVD